MKTNVLKSVKNIYLVIKVIYATPALFIHELSHAFMGIILGLDFGKIVIKITKEKNSYKMDGTCYGNSFFDKRDVARSLAPAIIPIITIGLMFVNFPIFGLIFLYEVSTYKFILPSSIDIESAKKSLKEPYWRICK